MSTPSRQSFLRRLLRGAWLLLTNVVVLVALLLFTNLLSAIAMTQLPTLRTIAGWLGRDRPPPTSAYADLPLYHDKAKARLVWEEFEESRHVEFAPFVEWRRKPYAGTTVHVDEQGDRFWPGAPVSTTAAPVVRLFGGSSIWGTGGTDEETIPAALHRLRPGYRVLNHGESEYNSRQNFERLVNLLGRGQRVDVAVFYEGFNDVLTLCRRDVDLNGHGEEPRMRWVLEQAGTARYFLIGKTQELLTNVFSTERADFACDEEPARARAVAMTVVNQWRLAQTLLEAQGGKLIVVLQPVAALGRPRLDYFEQVRTPGEPSRTSALTRQLRAVYPYWQKLARKPGNEWLHDFTSVFDGGRAIYIDQVHGSAEGNAIVARRLAPLVDSALR